MLTSRDTAAMSDNRSTSTSTVVNRQHTLGRFPSLEGPQQLIQRPPLARRLHRQFRPRVARPHGNFRVRDPERPADRPRGVHINRHVLSGHGTRVPGRILHGFNGVRKQRQFRIAAGLARLNRDPAVTDVHLMHAVAAFERRERGLRGCIVSRDEHVDFIARREVRRNRPAEGCGDAE